MATVQDNLQRVRELVVEAANDTNGTSQRTAITQEINSRLSEINRITEATTFNGQKLLSGTVSSFRIQVGANNVSSLDTINIASGLGSATATGLGFNQR